MSLVRLEKKWYVTCRRIDIEVSKEHNVQIIVESARLAMIPKLKKQRGVGVDLVTKQIEILLHLHQLTVSALPLVRLGTTLQGQLPVRTIDYQSKRKSSPFLAHNMSNFPQESPLTPSPVSSTAMNSAPGSWICVGLFEKLSLGHRYS